MPRTLLREAYESGKDLVLDKDRKQKTKYKYDQISKVNKKEYSMQFSSFFYTPPSAILRLFYRFYFWFIYEIKRTNENIRNWELKLDFFKSF